MSERESKCGSETETEREREKEREKVSGHKCQLRCKLAITYVTSGKWCSSVKINKIPRRKWI